VCSERRTAGCNNNRGITLSPPISHVSNNTMQSSNDGSTLGSSNRIRTIFGLSIEHAARRHAYWRWVGSTRASFSKMETASSLENMQAYMRAMWYAAYGSCVIGYARLLASSRSSSGPGRVGLEDGTTDEIQIFDILFNGS